MRMKFLILSPSLKSRPFSVVGDHLYKIIVELLAILCFPIIISLVNRNNKPLFGPLHIFHKLAF